MILDNKLDSLLKGVADIQKEQKEKAQKTGENYNVFEILRVMPDELSHSIFLANLLDPKAKHGQKDFFLKAFISMITPLFENNVEKTEYLNGFNTSKSKVYTEKHIGRVDIKQGEGGRIDILISDGGRKIIVENKIYATDQEKQLKRYWEFDKTAPIVYLTLNGSEPSENSRADLSPGNNYICLSYKYDIINWIEQSVKNLDAQHPIKETLKQYITTIKKLTNQPTNNIMSKKIVDTILKTEENFDAFIQAQNSISSLRNEIFETTVFEALKDVSTNLDLHLELDKEKFLNKNVAWQGFNFKNEELNRLNLKIRFAFFVEKGYNKLTYGFLYADRNASKPEEELVQIKKLCKNFTTNNHPYWLCFKEVSEYYNWENLQTLKKIKYEAPDFKGCIQEKTSSLLEIVRTVLPQKHH